VWTRRRLPAHGSSTVIHGTGPIEIDLLSASTTRRGDRAVLRKARRPRAGCCGPGKFEVARRRTTPWAKNYDARLFFECFHRHGDPLGSGTAHCRGDALAHGMAPGCCFVATARQYGKGRGMSPQSQSVGYA